MLGSERNPLISGATGSATTTLLNALASLLPAAGCRPPAASTPPRTHAGAAAAPRQLRAVRGAAPRRPRRDDPRPSAARAASPADHVVGGEVRGAEAADLLQALNTGHGGPLATVRANSAAAALSRLAPRAMQVSDALPWTVGSRGWSTASRPSFTTRARPKGCAGLTRWSASAATTPRRTRWVIEPVWPPPSEGARNGPSSPKRATGSVPRRKRGATGPR